jgi:hypothetical protein
MPQLYVFKNRPRRAKKIWPSILLEKTALHFSIVSAHQDWSEQGCQIFKPKNPISVNFRKSIQLDK